MTCYRLSSRSWLDNDTNDGREDDLEMLQEVKGLINAQHLLQQEFKSIELLASSFSVIQPQPRQQRQHDNDGKNMTTDDAFNNNNSQIMITAQVVEQDDAAGKKDASRMEIRQAPPIVLGATHIKVQLFHLCYIASFEQVNSSLGIHGVHHFIQAWIVHH